MVIQPGHPLAGSFGGIHHIYANDKALKGLQRNKYPKGAVFVFDLWEYGDDNHALVERRRKCIGVMEHDDKRFAANGGWGFEAFHGGKPDKRLVTDGGRSCFECHQSQKASRYVFTRMRD